MENTAAKPPPTFMVWGDMTEYGDKSQDHPRECIGVTRDPDEAEMLAEMEVLRYAAQAGVQWKRTSKNRWKAWEPGEFLYVVLVAEHWEP
jgi:hypothetical protein